MDTLTRYQKAVKNLVLEYAQYKPSYGEVETEAVIDTENNHYELLYIGWHDSKRIHGSVIHIDIINDKIWIQHDGTSEGIANELVEAGIPKDAIVLGFQPPHVRQYTEFAVA